MKNTSEQIIIFPEECFNESEVLMDWAGQTQKEDERKVRQHLAHMISSDDYQIDVYSNRYNDKNIQEHDWVLYFLTKEKKAFFHHGKLNSPNYFSIALTSLMIVFEYVEKSKKIIVLREYKPNNDIFNNIKNIASTLIKKYKLTDILSTVHSKTLLKELLVSTCYTFEYKISNKNDSYTQQREKCVNMIAMMASNSKKPYSTTEMEKYANMSIQNINRIFKSSLGKSYKYLSNLLRLEHIRKALIAEDFPIYSIAQDFHFNDPDYLIQKFSQTYNITPLQFRKLSKTDGSMTDQKDRFHYTNQLLKLNTIPVRKELISDAKQHPQNLLVVCNTFSECVYCKWIGPAGEERTCGTIPIFSRLILGSATNQYYVIENIKGEFLTSFMMVDEPSYVVC